MDTYGVINEQGYPGMSLGFEPVSEADVQDQLNKPEKGEDKDTIHKK